jgi:hypothetical protein
MLTFSILGCEDDDLPDKAWISIIAPPENNLSYRFGSRIYFRANAYNPAKGFSAVQSIVWTISTNKNFSYRDTSWQVDTLSIGTHTMTATLPDDGVTDSITIAITPN